MLQVYRIHELIIQYAVIVYTTMTNLYITEYDVYISNIKYNRNIIYTTENDVFIV